MLTGEWLLRVTRRTPSWWFAAVQAAARGTSTPSEDPNHDTGDPVAFLAGIARHVVTALPVPDDDGVAYDPNMRAAAVMAVVCALWYGRLHHAKLHDPARPVSLRQRAYEKWLMWVTALATAVLDEREDAAFFPGQKWDFPFTYDAQDGTFV